MKTKLFLQFFFVLVMALFVGCSKNDDDKLPSSGSIDAAVGTYKGTIDIVGGSKKFDEILVVTKVSNTRVKVKAQNTALGLPEKEIDVLNNMNVTIQALATETQGLFIYTTQNKSLSFLSKQTAEGQLQYSFEGIKQ